MRAASPRNGFTLTELMVVIAILGILIATSFTIGGESKVSAKAFADQVSGELETVRMRALSTRRWHRVTVTDRAALVEQATTTGMVAPTEYESIRQVSAPAAIRIVAVAATTAAAGGGPRSDGDGFAEEILFAPDGSSVARTLWVSDRRDRAVYRIAVYGSTGRARVFKGW